MSARDELRLAALERTLVAAAAQQAQQRRRRRRRAIVLAVVAAPLTLAAAGSMAGTEILGSVDQHLGTLRDDRLVARQGSIAVLEGPAGATARDPASKRTWTVAGRRIVGYITANGRFCFRFGELNGGCIQKDTLSSQRPLVPITDNNAATDDTPGTFRVYGIALDGVAAVSLRARGSTRRAIVGRNAFFLEANSLASRRGFTGTLIVRLQDGTTHRQTIRVGGIAMTALKPFPTLPGLAPVANTAA